MTRRAVQRPHLLKTTEVAAAFGVDVATVRRWVSEGLLFPVKTPGGQFRYHAADVERLMAVSQQRDEMPAGVL